jgi:uncharacterized protein (DUF2141 family)
MKSFLLTTALFLMALPMLSAQAAPSKIFTLEVVVNNLPNSNGHVGIQVMDAQKKTVSSAYVSVWDQGSMVTFHNLPPGKYAVRMYHDENNNGKMDANMMGIPTEKYGFSNNVTGIMGTPPEFSKMLFDLNKTTTLTIDAN